MSHRHFLHKRFLAILIDDQWFLTTANQVTTSKMVVCERVTPYGCSWWFFFDIGRPDNAFAHLLHSRYLFGQMPIAKSQVLVLERIQLPKELSKFFLQHEQNVIKQKLFIHFLLTLILQSTWNSCLTGW